MAGSTAGGLKARDTNYAKQGRDFYKRIGSKGGKISKGGGFSYDDRTFLQKLFRKPKRAQIAGAKGGAISRRRKNG